MRGDRVIQSYAQGVTGDGAPVTEQTPFPIGSVSKPVTATVVLRLVEEGLIGLDDLVRHYYQANKLWSGSYFAGSVGGAPLSIIKQYIEQQNRPG